MPADSPPSSILRAHGMVAKVQMLDASANQVFMNDLANWLDEVLACCSIDGDSAEIVLAHPASGGGTWLCRCHGTGAERQLDALTAYPPDAILTRYAYPLNDYQYEDVEDSYAQFIAFTGRLFPVPTPSAARRLLRLKIHRDAHWLMKFPLDLYIKFALPGFTHYASCQWLVTERQLDEVARTQRQIEHDLANTTSFLRGAVIIINTYRAHQGAGDAANLARQWQLLGTLLHACANIAIDDADLQLRWAWNPSPAEVTALLLASETRFVYANFEAASGAWVTGDQAARSYRAPDNTLASPGAIDLAALAGKLPHVSLLRVFHCNSLFNASEMDSEPVGRTSLGAQLLATGAWFVEGSLNEEAALDFIAVLYQTLLCRADLQYVLFGWECAGNRSLRDILTQANEVVEARGLPCIVNSLDAIG